METGEYKSITKKSKKYHSSNRTFSYSVKQKQSVLEDFTDTTMKFLIVFAAIFGVAYSASVVKRQAQSPGVWTALDQLRGKTRLSIDDITVLFTNSKAGEDYPNLATIPETTSIDCGSVKPGFYADVDTKCQVIRRCDVNGNASAYLCPNMTIFNQITLVCHWFWDVDCSKAKSFYDYSNSRLYKDGAKLLDDEPEYVVADALGAVASSDQSASKGKESKGKESKGKGKAGGKSKSKAKVAETTAAAAAAEEATTAAAAAEDTTAAAETTAAAAE